MREARRTLIGLQVLYVVFSPLWFLFAAFAAMWFDAPGSTDNKWMVGLFYLTWAYPIALIGAATAAWIAFARGRYTPAVLWNLIPLMWVIPIAGMFLYVVMT